jgi:hypothetical protein
MENNKFLAQIIHEKLSYDLDGNKSLSIQILPLMEHPTKKQYNIPVIIQGQKLVVSIKPVSQDPDEEKIVNLNFINSTESFDESIF